MGLTAWLLVDKAVLATEELLNREQFEDALYQALAAQRDELRGVLKRRYDSALQAGFDRFEDHFASKVRPPGSVPKKDFVPARAAQE